MIDLFKYDLQMFAEGDDGDAKDQESEDQKADDKNDGKRDERETDDHDEDLSKWTMVELLDKLKSTRRQTAEYRTRARTVATERDDLKKRVEADDRKKLEDENRYQDIANDEKAKREAAQRERDEARSEINRVKVFGEVRDQARVLGLKNSRILSRLDLSTIIVGDDGEVDDRDVIDFVRGVKKDYPELFEDPKSRDERQQTDEEKKREEERRSDDERKRKDEQENRDRRKSQPAMNDKGDKIDWRSLTPEQFAAKEKELFGSSSSQRW